MEGYKTTDNFLTGNNPSGYSPREMNTPDNTTNNSRCPASSRSDDSTSRSGPLVKTAVLLLNLGGPEKPQDVGPFLYNLFSDRQIIRLGPALLQKPIARFIAWRRTAKSRRNYMRIGGSSPINLITRQQARALEEALAPHGNIPVRACMRYWHPSAQEVLDMLSFQQIDRLIALPLYPHYSVATTGSSLADLERANRHHGIPLTAVRSWPTENGYIQCLAARIREGLARFRGAPAQLIYSAHSLPRQFVDEGDPYVEELHQTIGALERVTGLHGELCYQSRSGPVEWLTPSTPDKLAELAARGIRNVLVVPISFVSDHVETLCEIEMDYRDLARGLGMRLEATRGLNDDPTFINALKELVLKHLNTDARPDQEI